MAEGVNKTNLTQLGFDYISNRKTHCLNATTSICNTVPWVSLRSTTSGGFTEKGCLQITKLTKRRCYFIWWKPLGNHYLIFTLLKWTSAEIIVIRFLLGDSFDQWVEVDSIDQRGKIMVNIWLELITAFVWYNPKHVSTIIPIWNFLCSIFFFFFNKFTSLISIFQSWGHDSMLGHLKCLLIKKKITVKIFSTNYYSYWSYD